MEHPLSPSLWRTCRVLANRRRLTLLQAMLNRPPQTVGQLADRCGLPPTISSQYLRMLQARGLARAIREGRWVLYELHAEPSVADSVPILFALKADLSAQHPDMDSLLKAATACTHPRRVALLAILSQHGPLSVDELRVSSGISHAALFRHLDKLTDRKFIRWHERLAELSTPPGALAAALLSSVTRSPT